MEIKAKFEDLSTLTCKLERTTPGLLEHFRSSLAAACYGHCQNRIITYINDAAMFISLDHRKHWGWLLTQAGNGIFRCKWVSEMKNRKKLRKRHWGVVFWNTLTENLTTTTEFKNLEANGLNAPSIYGLSKFDKLDYSRRLTMSSKVSMSPSLTNSLTIQKEPPRLSLGGVFWFAETVFSSSLASSFTHVRLTESRNGLEQHKLYLRILTSYLK